MFKNVSVFSNLIRLLSFLSHLTSLHFFSYTLTLLILIFNHSSFINSSFLNHCYSPFLKPYHFLTKISSDSFFFVLVLIFFLLFFPNKNYSECCLLGLFLLISLFHVQNTRWNSLFSQTVLLLDKCISLSRRIQQSFSYPNMKVRSSLYPEAENLRKHFRCLRSKIQEEIKKKNNVTTKI